MIVLGIDPGGHTTGIILRSGKLVLAGALVVNPEPELCDEYLNEVLETARDFHYRGTQADVTRAPVVAVEDVVEPNPHMGLANVRGLMHTAQVLGALRSHFDVVLVRPGGHGSAPLQSYPAELVGDREPKGTGKLRHARSAWDVAGAAEQMNRSLPLAT